MHNRADPKRSGTALDMTQGARLYGFVPHFAGPIDQWSAQLDRIAALGFDWLALDPFHPVDGQGALLDPTALSPDLQPADGGDWRDAFRAFVREAEGKGLAVLVDLDLVERSPASGIARERPDWLQTVPAPLAAGDLPPDPRPPGEEPPARLAWARADMRPELVDYAREVIAGYRALGIRGFRCLSAGRIPGNIWRELIAESQAEEECLFLADVIGQPYTTLGHLEAAGFALVTSSSRWWDFTGPWLLDETAALEHIAPILAFPDHRSGPRLTDEIGGESERRERHCRFRLAFAATFGTAFYMPMGFEYGVAVAHEAGHARPGDWRFIQDTARFDLSADVAALNKARNAAHALGASTPLRMASAPERWPLAFVRWDLPASGFAEDAVLVVANPDEAQPVAADIGAMTVASGGFGPWQEVTGGDGATIAAPGTALPLMPLEVRILRASKRAFVPAPDDQQAALARLEELAADRVAIEAVEPEIDGGRFPVKRVVGEVVTVEADIFCDGHDVIDAALLSRPSGETRWTEAPMRFVDNDRWAGSLPLQTIGRTQYTIVAWRDLFAAWRRDTLKKVDAGLNVDLETIEGEDLVKASRDAAEAGSTAATTLGAMAKKLDEAGDPPVRLQLLLSEDTLHAMRRHGVRTNLSRYGRELEVVVDRPLAASAAWYELFPRSQSGAPDVHGTFDDVIKRLPEIRDMGFDVLYFPPIHPIGSTNRKGRNNTLTPTPDDPGSPYAIGALEGGHDAVLPELGGLDAFKRLVDAAKEHGLELALDFAIQCSPDHPWIKQHPEWFDWRPDGTIKFAENPPKKYEDIVNVHFYRKALPDLWYALRDITLFWIENGVRIFRVDNPHTKPFPFWEWMIREVQDRHPDAMFLAEAFTRPKVMARLAKVGFTQSYSYFTWRNEKAGLVEYLTELTQGPSADVMRPNFFVNTPDINPPYLQKGGRAAHLTRLVLGATLGGVYGVFEPFMVCDATPVPGKEEYLDSEKYQIRVWDLDQPGNIKAEVTAINRARRQNPALRQFTGLEFVTAWNDNIVAYVKRTPSGDNAVLVAVNLDYAHAQEASVELPLWRFGLPDHGAVTAFDLLTGERQRWQGKMQYLRLDPAARPFGMWRLTPVA
ncbi:maltotransferase domain-containing protein [Marinivivus vitaminiproducens]|uniref:maltotransferase domain-containing protein n=1 Tax=Marinivivus vitaminiproducens TaxID=3035935 RepID=UPI0027A353C0|nr:DUF3416 domain-containing protein [Geminicoccaceae bacterium SCSIO 64248]